MPNLEISQETYDQLLSEMTVPNIEQLTNPRRFPGGKLFIRTVTYHAVGQVVGQIGEFIELSDASCVFNSGSLSSAVTKGTLQESEFVGKMFINRNSITDMFPWKHDLPKASK
jgi:hypothetical protein